MILQGINSLKEELRISIFNFEHSIFDMIMMLLRAAQSKLGFNQSQGRMRANVNKVLIIIISIIISIIIIIVIFINISDISFP